MAATPPRRIRKTEVPKRPNGTGTVFWNGKVWVGQVSYRHPVTGQAKRRTKKSRTQKEALIWIEQQNTANRSGISIAISNEKLTVEQFLDAYLQRYASKKAPETYRNYVGACNRICSVIGGLNASTLKPRDVEMMLEELSTRFGKNTVNNAYRVLRAAYNKAVKLGDFIHNPVLKVDAPGRILNPSQNIPIEDVKAIYAAASLNPYSFARVQVGLFVPIRPGEILGLKWSDVNWESKTLTVQRQLQRVKGQGLVFRETKDHRSHVVPLTNTTLDILRSHKIMQDEQKSTWEEDHDLIFPNTIGKPLDAKRDGKWWQDILKRAGVKHYQVYQLRKTAISLLENLGTPPSTLMKFTGHSNISTVMNHYAFSTTEADERALQGLEKISESLFS